MNILENTLVVKDLVKDYGDFKLDKISLSIKSGSIIGLIGQNGAGKSTLIKCILNIIKRDSGEIYILGEEMSDKSKLLRNEIGVVFDSINFHETLNVIKISKILQRIYLNWDKSLFEKYLEKFNLPRDKMIKSFSKGMKMKLSIAIALAHKARLLILDEATSGLDPIVRDEILNIFLEFVKNRENSILISSHITSDLEKISDEIIFIHEGKIKFIEKKDSLDKKYSLIRCSKEEMKYIKDSMLGYLEHNGVYEVLISNNNFTNKENFKLLPITLDKITLLYIKGEKIWQD